MKEGKDEAHNRMSSDKVGGRVTLVFRAESHAK